MDFLKGRKGRKNKDKEAERTDSISSPSLDSMGSPPSTMADSTAPPRSRRFSGWTEDKTKQSSNQIEQERFSSKEATIDDIPTIPDLDIDLTWTDDKIMEMAPSHSMSLRMAYNELCQDSKMESYAALEDLDLGLLEKCLEPGDLHEPDDEWAWDTLFAQISTEIPRKGSAGLEQENGVIGTYIH